MFEDVNYAENAPTDHIFDEDPESLVFWHGAGLVHCPLYVEWSDFLKLPQITSLTTTTSLVTFLFLFVYGIITRCIAVNITSENEDVIGSVIW